MFGPFKRNVPSQLDDPITRVLSDMDEYGPESKEYQELLTSLERLTKLKMKYHQHQVSRDTMAIVAGNLLGILIIVTYEHANAMTSKALAFVLKTK